LVGTIIASPNRAILYSLLIGYCYVFITMSEIKDKLKGVKDKVLGAGEDAKDTVTGHDEDRYATGAGQKDDPLTSYRDKEPMTPAKIKEHEPTAVKREMTERIADSGQTGTNPEESAEIARKKGMAKGTAGAAETGSEYEQGSAGSNK
jgi:hypothetical protein